MQDLYQMELKYDLMIPRISDNVKKNIDIIFGLGQMRGGVTKGIVTYKRNMEMCYQILLVNI